MQFAKLIEVGYNLLKVVSENDGTIDDWKYLEMFNEFVEMRNIGCKYRVAVDELSEKYGLSKTKIERVIRRFRKDVA